MIGKITFDPVFHIIICIAVLAVVLIILISKEYPLRHRHHIRLLAMFIVFVSITGLLLRPSIQKTSFAKTILLTDGFDPDSANAILTAHPGSTVFSTPDAEDHKSAARLQSIHSVAGRVPGLDYILGEGLPPFVLNQNPGSFVYLPGKNRSAGIQELYLPEKIYMNQGTTISGRHYADVPTKLVLASPSHKHDSVLLPQGNNRFRLFLSPQHSGIVEFKLTSEDSLGRSESILPLDIRKPPALSILFLQDYPTFEGNYLKNYLGRDHSITIRHRLSRSVYRYEYVNAKRTEVVRISEEMLEKYDLLLMDEESLEALNTRERQELMKGIVDGLGCVVLFSGRPSPRVLEFFPGLSVKDGARDTMHVSLPGLKKIAVSMAPFGVEKTNGVVPVLAGRNRIAAGYVSNGFGKAGFSFLGTTFHMMLEGDSTAYARIWNEVTGRISRRRNQMFQMTFPDPMPYRIDEPLRIRIKSTGPAPDVRFHNISLPVREDEILDNVWHTTIWPDLEGWNELVILNDSSTYPFYVHGEDALETLRKSHRRSYTSMRASATPAEDRETIFPAPIDPLYFYLLFLLGMGCLWLLPKLG